MGIGAAEAEAGDTRDRVTGVARPVGRLLDYLQVPGVELDVGVGAGVVQRCGQLVVLHREHHLGECTGTRSGFHVPEVRLRRAEQGGGVGLATAADHAAECVGLDRIAEYGAGAVRLDVVDAARVEGCVGVRRAQHLHLCLGIGRGQAVGATVGVDRRACDHGEHGVAIASGVGHALEHEQPAALGADHAIGVGRERLDVTVLGLRADAVEAERRGGSDDHVDATGERDIGFARPQATHGLVNRDQRRRARGVHGHRRAVEVEEVRDAVGDDRRRRSGQRVGGGVVCAVVEAHGREQLVVVGRRADEDTDRCALEVTGRDVRVFECLPRQFEREALLRVDHLDLAGAHLEEVGVEALDVVEVTALDVGFVDDLGQARVGLELGPAVLGQIGDAVAPGDQCLPGGVGGVPCLGEACREADDRDVVCRVAFTNPEGLGIEVEPFVGVALDDALGQHRDGGVVVGDRCGQHHAGLVLDVGGERHGIARGQTELLHRTVVGDLFDRDSGRRRDPLTQPVTQLLDGQPACGFAIGGLAAGGLTVGDQR